MNNSTIWEACQGYGDHILACHSNPTLFDKWLSNYQELETQLMVDTDGEKVGNKYTDGRQTWSPIRWPWKANTPNPEWRDYPRQFLFEDHLTAIGSTGWNWQKKESHWLGYDFDSLVGHAEGVGIGDTDLEAVVRAAPDFVDVIRSTRGGGRHLYIFFNAPYPKTTTHTEHAALARSFLPIMSSAAKFDFSTKMDVCGSILWMWHKEATDGGFTPVQEATRNLDESHVPPNWRDHLEVVKGGRTKVKVKGWTPDGETTGDELDEETQSYAVVKLEEVHKRFLSDLEDSGYTYCWIHDHHLAQTHTQAIKKVYDAWSAAGHPMKGPYATNSPDTDAGKVNSYIRPRAGGGWDVYRFGQVNEHPLWEIVNGKTHVTLNCAPSLRQGAIAAGGIECADLKSGYQLPSEEALYAALKYLNSDFKLPQGDYMGRTFSLRSRPGDLRIILSMSRLKTDKDSDFVGWEKKPKLWVKLLGDRVNSEQDEDRLIALWDNKVRVVKSVSMTETGNVAGAFQSWMLKDSSNKWVIHPKEHIGVVVGSDGLPAPMVTQILGKSVENAWTKVHKPFEPEYPGGREWNYNAPQLVYTPVVLEDGQSPHHPHWDMIFDHCGEGLDKYITELEWCKEWGIKCGGDYLRAWVAAMFRFPYSRLPYLFMYSEEQSTGKSTFHESIRLLLTCGVAMADRALTSTQDFNGELRNAILGVIDEVDISKEGTAVYNKVKEWTTGLTISVHAKYKEVYEQPSTLHLLQMANNRGALPVFGGDSRITSMEVQHIDSIIGKEELFEHLRDEGPHFVRTLMDLPLPKLQNRLRVPVIETEDKLKAMAERKSALEVFLDDYCARSPGCAILLRDLYAEFVQTLEKSEKPHWSKGIMRRQLPDRFPVGRWNRNMTYVGNISLGEPEECSSEFTSVGGNLVRDED